jgi:hypothetical protein
MTTLEQAMPAPGKAGDNQKAAELLNLIDAANAYTGQSPALVLLRGRVRA